MPTINEVPTRLLTQVVSQNAPLDLVHDLPPEKADNGKVHSGVHEAKAITGRCNAVERRQLLKGPQYRLDFRKIAKAPRKGVRCILVAVNDNDSHGFV